MQGKPPPNQAAQGPQSSPSGMTPPSAQGPQATGPSGGLMGIAPPEGADGKRKGRGGAGSQLSDVRWGMIFKLGWKLLGFFKLLTIGYCVMMLVQNCVTLGTSQLMGEVTNESGARARLKIQHRQPTLRQRRRQIRRWRQVHPQTRQPDRKRVRRGRFCWSFCGQLSRLPC